MIPSSLDQSGSSASSERPPDRGEEKGGPGGELLTPDDLSAYPIFHEVPRKQLERLFEWNERAVVRRRFRPGEIVCRQGDYGSTAFYIVRGRVEVFITSPIAHARSQKQEGKRGWLSGRVRKFATLLLSAREDPREEEEFRRYIPIDAPIDLAMDEPVGQLHDGDLFGEMTCLSFYPRSATVRAVTDCEMLEMERNVLELLKKQSKTFREKLERDYRQRALDTHLRSVREFASLPDDFLDELRARVELVSYDPGEVICRQGEPADSFYLIRLGFVRVSQQHPGGEIVLAYLSRGQYFGEIGLLSGGVRTATCTALDHVEVVRLRKDDFVALIERFPAIRAQLEAEAQRRIEATQRLTRQVTDLPLDDFLQQGLMNAQNVLLIDLERCTRCDECVKACAAAHDGVTRLIRDGLRYDKYLVATSCRQCTDPVCMIGCPVGSIRRRESLEIVIEDWCIGCGKCAAQCPYGNINMHEFEVARRGPSERMTVPLPVIERKAVICDLCAPLGEPSCVYACPHQAALRVNPREFFFAQGEHARPL
ncbi:MAG TPA: cyclic nucleotide-binding domain-containing protein [Blastocatellia bacterium]|nr:cyclic nucleotide-binding domain-containing protein [Blastocatellia bacterium]